MTSHIRIRIALRHLALAAVLIAIVVWLWQLAPRDLTAPPVSLDELARWIDHHDAVTLAFALVRFEAIVLAGYLLIITVLSATVRVLALPRATRLVELVTLPVLRGMFGGAAALGVMAIPSPVHLPAQTATTAPAVTTPADEPTGLATLHLEVPAEPVTVPVAAAIATNDTWAVEPGDSLWSIAASHLADVNGRPGDEAEISVMWRRLIDLNRDRLVNPDDPDLIFADQVFDLPAMETG